MIALFIQAKGQNEAEKITDYLLYKKLAFNLVILPKVIVKSIEDNKVIKVNESLIIGKTKALLYEEIINEVKSKFPNCLVYGLPIAAMDWEKFEKLSSGIRKI